MSVVKKKSRNATFNNFIEEMKRVSWSSRKETMRLSLVVVGVSLIIGLYIGIIDIALMLGAVSLAQVKNKESAPGVGVVTPIPTQQFTKGSSEATGSGKLGN